MRTTTTAGPILPDPRPGVRLPDDDLEQLHRVLHADDDTLDRYRRADPVLRRALRDLSHDPEVDSLRTLCAAARVERRRRAIRAELAKLGGTL